MRDDVKNVLESFAVVIFFAPVWVRVIVAIVSGKPWTGNKALKTLWTKGLPATIACMVVGVAMYLVGRFVL